MEHIELTVMNIRRYGKIIIDRNYVTEEHDFIRNYVINYNNECYFIEMKNGEYITVEEI